MKKLLTRASLSLLATPLLVIAPVGACAQDYFTDFAHQQPELFYENYERGVFTSQLACGTDACVTFGKQGQRNYGKFTVNPSPVSGYYTDAAVSQVELGVSGGSDNAGPYTASYRHPVTMEAKVKWSSNYDLLGQSDAQGTSGIVLWNSAYGDDAQGAALPDYAQLGFVWASQDVYSGLISGFTASTFVDQFPIAVTQPTNPINIHDWVKVKIVWSENASGTQSVAYYANGHLISTDTLPEKLHGMSLEIWNDNQEPYLCEEGLCPNYANPDQPQSFYVDYVKITQS